MSKLILDANWHGPEPDLLQISFQEEHLRIILPELALAVDANGYN